MLETNDYEATKKLPDLFQPRKTIRREGRRGEGVIFFSVFTRI
jgi:hypothetical protein